MAQLAIHMDVNGPSHGLQEENAYFDATHTRVHGFKTFVLLFHHSPMRKSICLATMEMRSENSTDIAIFFNLFNQILQEITGVEGYMFNPRCFLCGEGGANYKAVQLVYGDEFCKSKVRGYQFHFKQSVHRKKFVVPKDLQDIFIKICNELCVVTGVARYKILKLHLDEMANTVPELQCWITWWDDRKSHIFGPFQGGGISGVNLSEAGNSSIKPNSTMRSVHAA